MEALRLLDALGGPEGASGKEVLRAFAAMTLRPYAASFGVRQDGPGSAQEWLDAHNIRRCMHDVPALSWSSAMYDSVKETFQNQPEMEHSDSYSVPPPAGPAGENLAYGSYVLTPEQSTKMWYDEINDCGPFPGCKTGSTGVTGHFTPIVWNGVNKE